VRRLARVTAIAALLVGVVAADGLARDRRPRESLFIGLDTSGTFYRTGHEDALAFVAHYIYGHLNGLGGLSTPLDLFVGAIGAEDGEDASLAGQSIPQIEQTLRQRFPPTDTLTHFNVFFRRVARIAGERNLVLRPITVVLITDGLPDVAAASPALGAAGSYRQIDLGPLEYLAPRVTLRLAYASPPAAERWRTLVPRERVRLATVSHEVMKGWRTQVRPNATPAQQEPLWQWVRDNVDIRVRRSL
jgi:hypothetical protein